MAVQFRLRDDGSEYRASELSVVAGAHNLMSNETSQRRYSVKRAVVHKGHHYKRHHVLGIMLLELSTRIEFSEKIRPICVDDAVFPAGMLCVATGWGRTDPAVKFSYIHNAVTSHLCKVSK